MIFILQENYDLEDMQERLEKLAEKIKDIPEHLKNLKNKKIDEYLRLKEKLEDLKNAEEKGFEKAGNKNFSKGFGYGAIGGAGGVLGYQKIKKNKQSYRR